MSGMYPDNQDIEIFGEQVSWPGVGPDGKFTNGSFSDPMVRPSFIPAETINLILDNLESVITKCGGTPNAAGKTQIADALQQQTTSFFHADQVNSGGRDLMKVILGHGIEEMTTQSLRNEAIAEAVNELSYRCNYSGAYGNSPIPSYNGLMLGDYIDGMDLFGIEVPNGGTLLQAWSSSYKNNRIVIAGFNTYMGVGDNENNHNHILFVFRNIIAKGRMNATNTNIGGYPDSELRAWLEGANGDGSGVFASRLKNALGGNYLYTLRKSHKSSWSNHTVWIPSELELLGYQSHGDEARYDTCNVQFPIYQKSAVFRVKRYSGSRLSYWTADPNADYTGYFASYDRLGFTYRVPASDASMGISPAFCIH